MTNGGVTDAGIAEFRPLAQWSEDRECPRTHPLSEQMGHYPDRYPVVLREWQSTRGSSLTLEPSSSCRGGTVAGPLDSLISLPRYTDTRAECSRYTRG